LRQKKRFAICVFACLGLSLYYDAALIFLQATVMTTGGRMIVVRKAHCVVITCTTLFLHISFCCLPQLHHTCRDRLHYLCHFILRGYRKNRSFARMILAHNIAVSCAVFSFCGSYMFSLATCSPHMLRTLSNIWAWKERQAAAMGI